MKFLRGPETAWERKVTEQNSPGNQVSASVPTAGPPAVVIWTQYPPRTIWPAILGAVAIVLGAVLIIGTIANAVGAQLENTPVMVAATQAATRGPSHASVYFLLDLALAVLLLLGGIGLARRMPAAVLLLKRWAILNIIYSVGTFVVSMIVIVVIYSMGKQALEWPSLPPRATGKLLFAAIGVVVSAFPSVFILAWFGRQKIKDEVATWEQTPPPPSQDVPCE